LHRSLPEGDPALIRVAGLEAGAMAPFTTRLCESELSALFAAERELAAARDRLVDLLYSRLQGAPPESRRLLLAAKRDAFNRRSLAGYPAREGWEDLRRLGDGLADRVIELEARCAARRDDLVRAFGRERNEQRGHLVSVAQDPGLRRGLALSSPSLAAALDRLRAVAPERYGRKERGIEQSLLRYVSRAAYKLSPYSTLTRLALGEVRDVAPGRSLRLLGEAWSERSLLRLKRFVLDQISDVLLLSPPVRQGLRVELNNTLEEIEPDRFHFLQPGYWSLHEESGELRYRQDALVKVQLKGPVVRWLLSGLGREGRVYRELSEELDRAFPGADAARRLEKLLEIDFLVALPPWPSSAPHLEADILEHLRTLTDEALHPLTRLFERLVGLERGYATAEAPLRCLEEIDGLLDGIWREVSLLGGLGGEAWREKMRKGNYYEDVFLEAADGPGPGECLHISRAAVEKAARDLDPILRLAGLYSRRNDFLHSLSALMAERWPQHQEVGFLALFSAARPLWQEYQAFNRAAAREPGGWMRTFNPLGLPAGQELERLRSAVWSRVESCVCRREDATWIDPDALAEVASGVPEPYAPPVHGCLFLQPADAEGRLWVLNRLYEGTGRYGSRFTPVMSEPMRRRYAEHMLSHAVLERHGERLELLDLFRVQGDTLNVHSAQTPRVLATPGEVSGLPPSRTLSLRDLRVRLDPGTGLPRVVDAEGRPCLPVHLGGSGHTFMPTIIKFLSVFGPGDLKVVYPARQGRESGPLTLWERLVIGNVVLARRKWAIPPGDLPAGIDGAASDEALFEAVNRWRLAAGIPAQVFLTEKIPHKVLGTMYKPQYLDFTSPLFVPIFRAALAEGPLRLAVEEMLPSPEMFPRDAGGRAWAVEMQVDTLALRRAVPAQELPSLLHAPSLPGAERRAVIEPALCRA
jgi:hypothetical protein